MPKDTVRKEGRQSTYLVGDDKVNTVFAGEGKGAVVNNLVAALLVQVFHGDYNLGAW